MTVFCRESRFFNRAVVWIKVLLIKTLGQVQDGEILGRRQPAPAFLDIRNPVVLTYCKFVYVAQIYADAPFFVFKWHLLLVRLGDDQARRRKGGIRRPDKPTI